MYNILAKGIFHKSIRFIQHDNVALLMCRAHSIRIKDGNDLADEVYPLPAMKMLHVQCEQEQKKFVKSYR